MNDQHSHTKQISRVRMTPEREDEVVRVYTSEPMSLSELAKRTGLSERSARRVLTERGVPLTPRSSLDVHRTYHFRVDAFNAMDSEAAWYWLGFLLADGCLPRHGNSVMLALSDGCGSFATPLDGSNLDHLTRVSVGRLRGSGLGTAPSA